jgi:hypothetical protein
MEPSTREIKIDLESLTNSEPAYVTTFHEFGRFVVADTPEGLEAEYFKDKNGSKIEFFVSTSKDFISDDIKVLLPIEDTFYHFFIDSLPALVKFHKENPSVLFVLYLQKARPNPAYEKFLPLLFRILDRIKARYEVISTVVGMDFAPVYQFNNYVLIDQKINIHEMLTFVDIERAVDWAFRAARDDYWEENKLTPPFRKVYLTRGGKGGDLGPIAENYEYYKDDLRMYEEHKLEKFLTDLGYEIVEPETKFDSIMEQIFYMREVKTLVAVTCSGLANMIFMQKDQTVIELQAELVQVNGSIDSDNIIPKQNLHNFYQPLSFMGNHTYIAIPSRRDSDVVIEKLSKDAISYLL